MPTRENSPLLSLDESVDKAIQTIKRSAYKGTHVKVELEANLDRHWDEDDCEEYLREHVSQEAKDALTYGNFYNDGSVDSEFTFTVPIEKVRVVLEYIVAFREMASGAGSRFETNGAGMHIAILNNPSGNYPEGNNLIHTNSYNFAQSMTHLLPALYFLGSSNAKSRKLRYRLPQIDLERKYAAITGHRQVFEYRVFETCYDKPEAFLDFFCVIAKTMQFYKAREVKLPFFDTIGQLGCADNTYHLARFYYTERHIDALDLGLAVLKPDHKTIEQLKRERNFTISKEKLKQDHEKFVFSVKQEAKTELSKYQRRLESMRQEIESWYDREAAIGSMSTGASVRARTVQEVLDQQLSYQGIPKSEDEYVAKKLQDRESQLNSTSYCFNV